MDPATCHDEVWLEGGRGRVSALYLAVVVLCAVGFGLDLSEFAVGNALAAIFSDGTHRLSSVRLSFLLGAVYAGAAIGAPFFGSLADRFGMRRMMVLMLVWIGIATFAGAGSATATQLTVARFVAGMALGGFPPVMIAFIADVSPQGQRGRLVFWTCALAYLGPPSMLFGIRSLTFVEPLGVEGWRWGLMTAGTLSALAAIGFRWIPEAPHWLRARGHIDEALEAEGRYSVTPVRTGVSQVRVPFIRHRAAGDERRRQWRSSRGTLILYAVSYVTVAVATIAFPLVTGPVLIARGIGLDDVLLYVGLGTVGPVAGTLLVSLVVDRVPRHHVLIASAILMLLAVVAFFGGEGPIPLILSVCSFGIGMAIYLPAAAALGAEIFPVLIRATATSYGWGLNRLTAAAVPLLVLPFVHAGRNDVVAFILCGGLLATIAAVFSLDARRLLDPSWRPITP